jgi:nitronate monooxygenase
MHTLENLRLPLVAAPMFLISNPKMVIECCKAGVVGTFPALNQRTTEGFEEWVVEIKTELEKFEKETGIKPAPFGVNLIVHPTNPRVMPDIQIIVKHKVPLVITSLGAVSELVNAVHSYGGLVYHDVIKKRHAEKAAEAGVDGLILVSAGAGGHAGTLNPLAFVSEIKTFYKKTILLSGSISKGSDIASALAMGADLAYAGTAFINTTEANAPQEYQQMIIDSEAKDIVYTAAISGVSANFMGKSLEKYGITESQWSQSKKVDFGSELDAAQAEAKAWKTVWSAGHGVGAIHDVVPVKDLIARMKEEFKASTKTLNDALNTYTI